MLLGFYLGVLYNIEIYIYIMIWIMRNGKRHCAYIDTEQTSESVLVVLAKSHL